jgi:hypothetical protein
MLVGMVILTSHDHGDNSSHAEAKGQHTHNEFVTASSVDLEDGHMARCSYREEEEKDSGDGDINADCRPATQTGNARSVWRSLLGRLLFRHDV